MILRFVFLPRNVRFCRLLANFEAATLSGLPKIIGEVPGALFDSDQKANAYGPTHRSLKTLS